jgi:mannose/cellobiose epimerase-like protein (N-acyl-D-glucosamine 2-epimerase family)
MSIECPPQKQSITPHQPDANALLPEWVEWFWAAFLPAWINRARDTQGYGFFDLLDENAQATEQNRRTVLAQARLLFTFSHLALTSNKPIYMEAARVARDALSIFRKEPGLYCRARTRSGEPTGDVNDDLALSYDQSFVILGLSTWSQLNINDNVDSELEACWLAIANTLTDSTTGLLLEHDGVSDPAQTGAPNRAQNPHMHLYEAALQAFEMTDNRAWLERAQSMRAKGIEYFYDQPSGTITEFLTPDLKTLPGREGERREVGHQCEWAWLLHREIELGGDHTIKTVADRLLAFADNHGFASTGVMQGAAFDAVSYDANWCENQFLLWPQTEAIKTFAIRAEDVGHAEKAQALALLMFQQYFENRAVFANQLDINGNPVWTEALSRLLYHIVLALTEGARAGLWQKP